MKGSTKLALCAGVIAAVALGLALSAQAGDSTTTLTFQAVGPITVTSDTSAVGGCPKGLAFALQNIGGRQIGRAVGCGGDVQDKSPNGYLSYVRAPWILAAS